MSKYPSGYTQQGGPASAAIAGQSGKMLQMQLEQMNSNITATKEGAEQPFFLANGLVFLPAVGGSVFTYGMPNITHYGYLREAVVSVSRSGSNSNGFQFKSVSHTYYQLDFGAQSGGGVDVSGLSTANGWFGTAVGFGEVSTLAGQGQYITSKGLIRDINFAKLTQNSAPYATAGKILKSWGRGSAVLGFAVDAYAYRNNQISGTKFGVNTGVTAWGLGVGAAGMAIPAFIGGAMYFGIDTFYPGGFNGVMQNNGSLIQQNQQILGPGFNLYRDH